MIGETAAEAREVARDLFQRAVSCVSPAVIIHGHDIAGASHIWTLPDRYVPLQGRYRREYSFFHGYALTELLDERARWVCRPVGYHDQVQERDGPEIIGFHWHPGRRGQPDFPHLHVSSRVGSVQIAAKSHVPTGRVSLESVVRFLIDGLRVRPLRPDWEQVLDEGERRLNDLGSR